MYSIGMKVVCVNADFSPRWNISSVTQMPVKDGIYTTRSIGMWKFSSGHYLSLWLEEINNPVVLWQCGDISEIGFAAWRFRPIVSRKTDISIFTKMLTPKRVDA